MRALGCWFSLSVVAVAQSPAPQLPVVDVWLQNPASEPRAETVRASLPLGRGRLRPPLHVEIAGEPHPAVPLILWPDGSVCVLQAHVPVRLEAGESRAVPFAVRPGSAPAPSGEWRVDLAGAFHTEVEDPWGRVWTARPRLRPGAASSPRVRVQRFEALHEDDEGRAFLGLVGWLVTFHDERRAELTVALDNRAHHDVPPALGPVRLRRFSLVVTDPSVRLRPRFSTWNALARPEDLAGGGWRQDLLAPSDQLYLGDRTAKAFRFDLFLDGPEATELERATARAAGAPLRVWPDLDAVRASRAFGAHGGPAPASTDHGTVRYRRWRARARFGPFGGHGDPEDAAAQGTPRNGPSALHDALRWRSHPLLRAAETMVLQQGLRPTPGTEPRKPAATAPLRQGLSPRAIARPHGFRGLDYEHFSVDLLYDWFWLTGDPWARAELARAGSGIPRLLAGLPFVTARGEGWCLQGAVLVARATGDVALLETVRRRLVEDVLPETGPPPVGCVLPQPPHPDAFGPHERFDAPWQMAALVHGLHALWAQTGDAAVASAVPRVARTMAGPGWVEGVGPKYLVSARGIDRYILPVGHGPLEGTALMQAGAFTLAAELADDAADRELFERRAFTIAAPQRAAARSDEHASRWLQLWLDRRAARADEGER